MREAVARDTLAPAQALTDDEPLTRAAMVGTQIVGLAFARHVVEVEPLASMAADEIVELLAPALQHCLTASLHAGPPAC